MEIKIFSYIDTLINHIIGLVTSLPWYFEIPMDIFIVAVVISIIFGAIKKVW